MALDYDEVDETDVLGKIEIAQLYHFSKEEIQYGGQQQCVCMCVCAVSALTAVSAFTAVSALTAVSASTAVS
jgi:hypothetical protein